MHTCRLQFTDLPDTIPIFPLSGVLLLPRGQLPLNIFEPRYLAMVDDALATNRIIGMIQPRGCNGSLYEVGCAGRIVDFSETEGERYLITLSGVCRFRIREELATNLPYRTVVPDWSTYTADMQAEEAAPNVDRARLSRMLQTYFHKQEMSCDWDKVEITPDTALLTALAMICPLKGPEKQAILEAMNIQSRTDLFMTMLEMAASADSDEDCCH
ncbi:MAG: LON peptidase substrate-binding domain-containing protein [Alphaproteobacteria bacterium]|nr:LON peptidase substrate-binding domain-containing protein [Alphaproteobacteria bacterium]